MAGIVEFPVEAGGVLRVQAAGLDQTLLPAGPSAGRAVTRATDTLEGAMRAVTPALDAVTGALRKLSPDEVTVEFGILLEAETGVVVAKGSAEVHFTVTLAWKSDGTHNVSGTGGHSSG
jgi:hypothetical protein